MNQKGARNNPHKVEQYLKQEIEKGSVLGPLKFNPFGEAARFSPIDAIPKKDSTDLRIILNLSHPFHAESVNEAIDKDSYLGNVVDLHYPGVDALIKLIRKKGRGCLLFKRDLKKFYRQIFVCPGSVHLLGFVFLCMFFFDITLPMGLRITCYIGQRVSNALMFIYRRLSYEGINYLDDLGGAEIKARAKEAYLVLGKLLQDLGVWESLSKVCEPRTLMIFLRVLFNTLTMTLEVTPERLKALLLELRTWCENKTCASLKEVQSLLGKLNFAASTVRAGRVFLARIINFICEFNSKGGSYVRCIPEEVRYDIRWWYKYLREFNGVAMIPEIRWSRPDAEISTDSCLTGCGGWS